MNHFRFTLPVWALAAALTFPLTTAQAQFACNHGDDNFASAPCCTPVVPNIPNPPAFTQQGTWGCIKDCELEAQFGVTISANINPALCDIWVSQITITPTGVGGPAFAGVLICKYARTWLEFDVNGNPTRQVWRWLINGNLTPTAATGPMPCPTPDCAIINRVHLHGHYDAACEVDPVTGVQQWKHILTLNHLQGCVEHNAFSALPVPPPFDHPDRSYHLVSPAGFTFAAVPEAQGVIADESWRSLIFPNTCLAEGRLGQGQLQTVSNDWMCIPGTGGTFQYKQQLLGATTFCAGMLGAVAGIPLAFPLPPATSGIASLPLGFWGGAAGSFPGGRSLITHWGAVDFFDDCNPNEIPVHIVQGVTTRRAPGTGFNPVISPPPIYDTWFDLEHMLIPSQTLPGTLVPGWGTTYFQRLVWNMNL